MTTAAVESLDPNAWEPQPAAFALVKRLLSDFTARCQPAADLGRRMHAETGTRLIDWVDTIILPSTAELAHGLAECGYEPDADVSAPEAEIHRQPHGVFPRIGLSRRKHATLMVKVEFVADFLAAHGSPNERSIVGMPGGSYREARVHAQPDAELWVVERHGFRGYAPPREGPDRAVAGALVLESFRMRRRDFDADGAGVAEANRLIDAALDRLPQDVVCDLWFAAERDYWMRRNRAAQVQYARQQKLGLGWANHDHHTYRCSRSNFTGLIAAWEKLGFHTRERFHAGLQAGWGAQVMEQPVTGIITFNDVDLSPQELFNDFAHEPLEERDKLGTVGLWCALHGDSFLQAGMHHLEAMFDFEALRDQLEKMDGIRTMKPFTDFPYLRQAFTEGERWTVSEKRLKRAMDRGWITSDQAGQFRQQGALGSHLENLERNDGFKGFNQTGVSEIIAATDPRKQVAAVGASA